VARQGSDLVVGATEFEGADGLQVLRLEIEPAAVLVRACFVDMRRDEPGADGDVAQAGLGIADIVESDDELSPPLASHPGVQPSDL
jgi:hypothetical protein